MKKILLFIAAVLAFAGCNTNTPEQKKTVCQFTYQVNGLTVTFTNTSTSDLLFNHWEFGDGARTTTEKISHTYASAGTYTVVLVCYSGTKQYTCTKSITVSGGIQDTPKNVYLKGYKVYKIPQDGWYKINCTFNGFIVQSVSASTDETKLETNNLPCTITYNNPINLGEYDRFIINYSAIFLDLYYSQYKISYDNIYNSQKDTYEYLDEFTFTNSTNTVKIGVLLEVL